jgi:hypothetical protein
MYFTILSFLVQSFRILKIHTHLSIQVESREITQNSRYSLLMTYLTGPSILYQDTSVLTRPLTNHEFIRFILLTKVIFLSLPAKLP